MSDRHLIIFAKPPRLARAKRRLAADIGPIEALRFYRSSLALTLRRLGRDRRWRCWLFVDSGPARWPRSIPHRRQSRGDLGRRMDTALRSLPPGPTLLIGSDIPDVAPADIREAFRRLASKDVVFGPAADGGYWLVGLSHKRAAPGLFENVRWSSQYTLSDTLKNLGTTQEYALAATRHDVDDGPGFERWRRRMAS